MDDLSGPPQNLAAFGGTVEPTRPAKVVQERMRKLLDALLGTGQVTSKDLAEMVSSTELGLAAQGGRDIMNLILGKPRQLPPTLMPPDPYNPFQGGT